MPPLFGGRAQRQAQILARPQNHVKTLAQQQQGGASGTIPGTSTSPLQVALRTGTIQPYPPLAPNVAGVGHQVLNNDGNPVVVLGNLECTPDPAATPASAVPSFQDGGFAFIDASGAQVAGYSQTTGLWGFGGGGGGGGGGAVTIGNWSSDNQVSDTTVTVTAGSTATVGMSLAHPPVWLDSVGEFSGDGIYAVWAVLTGGGSSGYVLTSGPFNMAAAIPAAAIAAATGTTFHFTTPVDIQALKGSDLPRTAYVRVSVPAGSGDVHVRVWVDRLLYT